MYAQGRECARGVGSERAGWGVSARGGECACGVGSVRVGSGVCV